MASSVGWDPYQVAGPGAASPDSDITAVSRFRDNMEVWWTGPDNLVHGGFWYDDHQGWKGPHTLPGPVGSTPVGGLAAASRIGTSMEAWWIGSDTSVRGALWYQDGKPWRAYEHPVALPIPLPGLPTAAPTSGMAALSRIDTSMEIWWIGSDRSVQGAFWYKGQHKDAWQRYQVAPSDKASRTSGIAAVSRIDTAMEIWWVGPKGSVEGGYYYATDTKPWQTYTVAPEGSASQTHSIAAVSRRQKSMDVVWITPDGGVEGAFWNEGDDWAPYPDAIAEKNSASTTGGLAAVSRSESSIEVWWIGPDGSVQGAAWNEGVGWRRYDDPVSPKNSAAKTSGLAAMSRTEATTEVWWIADDGSVQLAVRDETSGPFSFRILRPDDLVHLEIDVVGCRLSTAAGVVPTPTPVSDTYVVQAGDTLWDIAEHFYNDPFKYHLIANANHLTNPNLITVGQRLTIPRLPPPPPPRSQIVAVDKDAHMIVHFGVQHIFEQSYPEPPANASGVAAARAANPSRVVFELPRNTRVDYTASGVLAALATLGLRVAPLAIPQGTPQDRPDSAKVPPAEPAPDQTAIEAPYRLVVSPNQKYGGFTHSAKAHIANKDSSRVELWHTRLGVRVTKDNSFVRIDENDTEHRTVRPIWAREKGLQQPDPPPTGFIGSLSPDNRTSLVRQGADPTIAEPEPFTVDRLYLSALGAWIDWRATWDADLYTVNPVSAYRHQARLGRDQYVRVETPVYLFPFGHRGTLVKITERKIRLENDPAAYLYTRNFIVLREHTRRYDLVNGTVKPPTNLPFVSVTIDPVVSPDLEVLPEPMPDAPFVPKVGGKPFAWKVTGVDHAGRQVTMTTALLAVPIGGNAWTAALSDWKEKVIKAQDPPELVHPIDVGGAEVAFAPETKRGDTTSRVQYIEFTGVADKKTSTPSMLKAHIAIQALTTLNGGSKPIGVKYRDKYITGGFPGNKSEIFLQLDEADATKLDFSGGSDKGGGFIEPSTAITALSRKHGAVGDAGAGGIDDGKFNPDAFLKGVLPKLFGLISLVDILQKQDRPLDEAPKLLSNQLGFAGSVSADYDNLKLALQTSVNTLQKDVDVVVDPPQPQALRQRSAALLALAKDALQSLTGHTPDQLVQALARVDVSTATREANTILTTLGKTKQLASSPDLAAFLRSIVQRSLQSLESVLKVAQIGDGLRQALKAPNAANVVRYDWFPKIQGWPGSNEDEFIFNPKDHDGLAISVEVRTPKDGNPQSDVSAQLRDFELRLPPSDDPLMTMRFGRLGFRVATGGKPEVDVLFTGLTFGGVLSFIEKLRQVIPFDGFADPPYVDVTPEAARAGFDLALPSLAIGVFTLENVRLGADCRVPFLGDTVTVGFFFCTKEAPFRLTVLAIGGGGWVGIRLSPKGLVMLEMGLEAGASLSVDLGVASGSVSVMIGVYLRLEDDEGKLTAYYRIRGEVEVLGIASASITLELSMLYNTKTGKLTGRASLVVEVEVAFFSASVEITCERTIATKDGDPALIDIMPPDEGGQDMWNDYYTSFAIGA